MANYPPVPTLIPHNHSVVTGVKFYTYGATTTDRTHYTLSLKDDWTAYVTDYSYNCDMNDNTRTSASVTLSGFDIMDAPVAKIEHKTTKNSQSEEGQMWDENTFYRLIKTYDFPANPSLHYEWDLGYFICNNNGSSISTTENILTLSLIGLSALLQPEYGGTPNRFAQGVTMTIKYKDVIPHIAGWSSHPDYTAHYSGNPDPNTKSTESGTVYTPEEYWDVTYLQKQITSWSLLTLFIPYGTVITDSMLYNFVMGTWAFETSLQDQSKLLPITDCILDTSTYKLPTPMIYEEKEFSYDVSRQEVIEFILDQLYVDGHYWVDEALHFHVKGKQEYYQPISTYAYYGDLVINEQRSYDDSGVYNSVNVISNTTFSGVEVTYFGRAENSHTVQTSNMRALYIENNSLQSDQECEDMAELEVQKTSWGHETFTVTLADNYCGFLMNCSNQVGCSIEYITLTGYTVPCILEKVSYSSNTITLVMRAFDTSTPPEDDT